MISFFRKIRKKLADDNQFFKYSRYAIGEIVLVVIGILIALSINNWNEERKLDVVKQKTFKNLQIEINKSLANLRMLKKGKLKVVSAIDHLFTIIDVNSKVDVEYNIDSLLGIIYYSSGTKFQSFTGVLTDVLNSNKIDLINNDSLLFYITSLSQQIDLVHMNEITHRSDLHNNYLPFIGKYYHTKNLTKFIDTFNSGIELSQESSIFKSNPQILLKNPEFESILNNQYVYFKWIVKTYEWLEEHYESILSLMDKEINNGST